MGPHFCCHGAAAVGAPGVRNRLEWDPGGRFEEWGPEEGNCYCQARFQAVHVELGHSGHFAWFHSRGHDPKIPFFAMIVGKMQYKKPGQNCQFSSIFFSCQKN